MSRTAIRLLLAIVLGFLAGVVYTRRDQIRAWFAGPVVETGPQTQRVTPAKPQAITKTAPPDFAVAE